MKGIRKAHEARSTHSRSNNPFHIGGRHSPGPSPQCFKNITMHSIRISPSKASRYYHVRRFNKSRCTASRYRHPAHPYTTMYGANPFLNRHSGLQRREWKDNGYPSIQTFHCKVSCRALTFIAKLHAEPQNLFVCIPNTIPASAVSPSRSPCPSWLVFAPSHHPGALST